MQALGQQTSDKCGNGSAGDGLAFALMHRHGVSTLGPSCPLPPDQANSTHTVLVASSTPFMLLPVGRPDAGALAPMGVFSLRPDGVTTRR